MLCAMNESPEVNREEIKEKQHSESNAENTWEEFDLSSIQGVLPEDRELTQNIGCVGKSQIKNSKADQKD